MRPKLAVFLFLSSIICVPARSAWQALGPFGGAAAVVQTDPHHPGTVIAATSNALLFRSTNSGDTWAAIAFPPELRSILHAFVIDPKKPGVYLAGLSSSLPIYSGILRSRDGGEKWEQVPGLKGHEVWSLAFSPSNPNVLAAGTRDGVYLTRDDGDTWNRISPASNRELEVVVSLAFDPLDSNTLYAGTPHLPWKTNNGGLSWSSAHTGMLDDSDVFSIQPDSFHPGYVFASACSGIYHSVNGAASWTKLIGARGASYRTYFIGQDPRDPKIVFAGTTHGLAKSSDGGVTWRQVSTHLSRYVAFDPAQPGRIYVATDDAGIQRSDDEGETLRNVNDGFCNRHLPSLAVSGESLYTNTIYESAEGGIYRFATGQWENITPASRLLGQQIFYLAPDGSQAGRLYAASYTSVLASPDSGRTWTALPGPFGTTRLTALYTGDGYLLAGAESGLFHSSNGGKIWKRMELPGASQGVRALTRVGTRRIAAITSAGLYLSSDGIGWEAAASLPDHAEPYGLTADDDDIIVATSLGLMRSNDAGQSWQPVRGGLDGGTVQFVYRHPANPDVLFAVQFGEVFESRDHGRSWAKISPPGPVVAIKGLAILPERPDRLFALTQNQGVFALALDSFASGASRVTAVQPGATRGMNEK
jgi:photosystem II stability/assembly factor-like uncharacterized protein